jgi:3-oxoacyl-[acyl-carrier-protein] synthase III
MRLHSIASYIPLQSIDNLAQATAFGESEEFVRSKIGALYLPKKLESEETSDLAVRAVENLISNTGLKLFEIDALVLVTQNGDGHNLPHTSAIVHSKLNLPKTTAVFDISLGCSGYVYGLHILKGFMQASGFNTGILVTADPYSKVIDPTDRSTTLLFGDAATATLLSLNGDWEMSVPRMGSNGAGAENIIVKDGRFSMNGRQVFNFAASLIPKEISTLLAEEGLQETDVDSYCLHQGSAGILDAISRHFPAVRDRFLNRMARTGNTVSSSIPLLLEEELQKSTNNKILISGFGVGLSWASMILNRREQ